MFCLLHLSHVFAMGFGMVTCNVNRTLFGICCEYCIYPMYAFHIIWDTMHLILDTPWKIKMEPKHGGLVQMIFRISIGWFLGEARCFSGAYTFLYPHATAASVKWTCWLRPAVSPSGLGKQLLHLGSGASRGCSWWAGGWCGLGVIMLFIFLLWRTSDWLKAWCF